MRGAGSIRLLAGIHLFAGTGACLAAPRDAPGDSGGADAGVVASACGNSRVDIAYVSRFAVDPDGYGYAELVSVGLVINSGDGALDLRALEVIDTHVDDELTLLGFATFDGGGPPIQPGEARGELSENGRSMVLATLDEEWTDPYAPELSGALTTARTAGTLHGTVLVGLGPHRVSLDLELEISDLGSPGDAAPRVATRASSTCVDDV